MRTVDATLTAAIQSGTGKPYIKVYIGEISLGTVRASGPAISYKLTGQALDVDWMNSNIGLVSSATGVWLERGLTIAGTDYTLTTGRFFIQTQSFTPDGHHLIHATLFPKAHYSAAGDGTYNTVLTAL